MKCQFPRHRVFILLILIAGVGLGYTINKDALIFSNQLLHAFRHNNISGIETVRCLAVRTMLTLPRADGDLSFHKNHNNFIATPYQSGGCDKASFDMLPANLPGTNKKQLSENQSSEIRNAFDHSYFIWKYSNAAIVSDSVYFHDASKNVIYAIYYWQTKDRVSLAVWNDSDNQSVPVIRSNISSNEFTDKLYAMFIEEIDVRK